MTGIDPKEASPALNDIEQIAQRVRQSTIYQLASLMMIMWGVLVFAGNSRPSSRRVRRLHLARGLCAGYRRFVAVSAFDIPGTGIRSFDFRMLAAMLLFFAFGLLCTTGSAISRRARWEPSGRFISCCSTPSLDCGSARPSAIGLGITALTLIGYFFIGEAFPLWMAFVNGGGLILGGLWMRRS